MRYLFTVTETLQKSIFIEAETEDEAYLKGREMYRNEEIVLDASDFVEADFETDAFPEYARERELVAG